MGQAKDPQMYNSLVKFIWDWGTDTAIFVVVLALITIGFKTLFELVF